MEAPGLGEGSPSREHWPVVTLILLRMEVHARGGAKESQELQESATTIGHIRGALTWPCSPDGAASFGAGSRRPARVSQKNIKNTNKTLYTLDWRTRRAGGREGGGCDDVRKSGVPTQRAALCFSFTGFVLVPGIVITVCGVVVGGQCGLLGQVPVSGGSEST